MKQLVGMFALALVAGCGGRPPVVTPPDPNQAPRVVVIYTCEGGVQGDGEGGCQARGQRPIPGVHIHSDDPDPSQQDRDTDGNGFSHRVATGVRDYVVTKDGWHVTNCDGDTCRGFAGPEHIVNLERDAPPARPGVPRVDGPFVVDDQGKVPMLGATMFWACWAQRHDQAKLDATAEFWREKKFLYVRAFGEVQGGPWDGINGPWRGSFPPITQARAIRWQDQGDMDACAQAVDRLYDQHGLRTELTLFASGKTFPSAAARRDWARRFVEQVIQPRLHKVALVEVANEWWATFGGSASELRDLGAMVKSMLPAGFPLALSSPETGRGGDAFTALYQGSAANFGTVHYDRNPAEDRYRSVRQPWETADVPGFPDADSVNEPVGPGTSVATENDPLHIVMAYLVGRISGHTGYVYTTDSGIYSQPGWEYPWDHQNGREIATALGVARDLLPDDIETWTRENAHWAGHPLDGISNQWLQDGRSNYTFTRAYARHRGDEFWVAPIGIRGGGITFTVKRRAHIWILNPLDGGVWQERDLNPGETMTFNNASACLIRGHWF